PPPGEARPQGGGVHPPRRHHQAARGTLRPARDGAAPRAAGRRGAYREPGRERGGRAMNPREHSKALILIGVLAAVGLLFLAYQFFLAPLQDYHRKIDELTERNARELTKITKIRKEQPRLQRWRLLALPGEPLPTLDDKGKPKPVTPDDRKEALD